MQKILIAEKDVNQCKILGDTIQDKYPSWYVDTVSDERAAEEKLFLSLDEGKKYSLFLINVQLSNDAKDRGGFLLAEKIRACSEYYRTPILFLSTLKEEIYHALFRYHCYNYI